MTMMMMILKSHWVMMTINLIRSMRRKKMNGGKKVEIMDLWYPDFLLFVGQVKYYPNQSEFISVALEGLVFAAQMVALIMPA